MAIKKHSYLDNKIKKKKDEYELHISCDNIYDHTLNDSFAIMFIINRYQIT
jgi:hypothetical protein